jgi:N,N'-diacetyllegionaminate synthase
MRETVDKSLKDIAIGNKFIGDTHPVFFIAEAGVNHNGSFDCALKLVDVARAAGADAIKFQTFKAEKLNTRMAPKSSYHIQTTGEDAKQTWFELLKTQELSKEAHMAIIEHCRKQGILFLSTPYDEDSADMLDDLGVSAFKLASTDLSNTLLIKHIAAKMRPMIISTAMSTLEEVDIAVRAMRVEGLEEFVVLQCTGNYPSCIEDSNLRVMLTYREVFGCHVGYSDHTPQLVNPIAATAMGARVYEKHITLDKAMPGPDHRMSLDPQELRETIRAIRDTEKALGSSKKFVLPDEKENREKLRKSLVTAVDIDQGTNITRYLITAKRPGTGIPPYEIEKVLGHRALKDIAADTLLGLDMLS